MNPETTPPLAETLKELRQKATPGEWRVRADDDWPEDFVIVGNSHVANEVIKTDAELICAAVNALPALLTAAEQGEKYRAALETTMRDCLTCKGTGFYFPLTYAFGAWRTPQTPCPSCAAARKALEIP